MEVGRICIKIAGRDANKKCVIVDELDKGFVMIDGETRRRKCNVNHIEPTETVIEITKGADHAVIVAEFSKMGIELVDKKSKPKTERPKRQKKADKKPAKVAKKKVVKEAPKKEVKKAEPKVEEKVEKPQPM